MKIHFLPFSIIRCFVSISARSTNALNTKTTTEMVSDQKPVTKPSSEKKTVTLTLSDIHSVKFPLNSFDFKLVCHMCFKKTGEGIYGSQYEDTQHICAHDILIVKLRQKNNNNWLKVRPRIESKFQQYGGYKLCTHFQGGRPCKVREDLCTFAHNKAEVELWTLDKEGDFTISGYINKLKSMGISKFICVYLWYT